MFVGKAAKELMSQNCILLKPSFLPCSRCCISAHLPSSPWVWPICLPSYDTNFLPKEEHALDRQCAVWANTQQNPELACSVVLPNCHAQSWHRQVSRVCSTEIFRDFTRQDVKGHAQTVSSRSLSVNSLACREQEAPSQNKAFTPQKNPETKPNTYQNLFKTGKPISPLPRASLSEPERHWSVWPQAKSQTRRSPAKHPEFGKTKPPKNDVHNRRTLETGSIMSTLYRSCSQFV